MSLEKSLDDNSIQIGSHETNQVALIYLMKILNLEKIEKGKEVIRTRETKIYRRV